MKRAPFLSKTGLAAAGLVAWLALTGAPFQAAANSNVDPDQAISWAPNLGWIHWRPTADSGASVGRYIASGHIYAQNFGWIHLGDGTPANGVKYSNTSAEDYGVNVDAAGRLRGFAYSGNIGWIAFEDLGAPRVDFVTGAVSGSIHAANAGWITLDGPSEPIRILHFSPAPDIDQDGLPDPWELTHAGNLSELSGDADTDLDGASDRDEFHADTDPLDPNDRLAIVRFELSTEDGSVSLEWRTRPNRVYQIETTGSLGPTSAWVPVMADIEFTGASTAFARLDTDPESAHQYFQIKAVPLLVER